MLICLSCLVGLGIYDISSAAESSDTSPHLAWDAVNLNVDGSTCTDLSHYDVAVAAPGQDLNADGQWLSLTETANCDADGCYCPLTVLPPEDGTYSLWVRAVDTSGNASAWAGPLDYEQDSVPPAVPANLRITVRVIVEVVP